MKNERIIVLGGGASGMLCALMLAQNGQKNITLIERNDRLGKKLSATGNGQGNVTNVNFGVAHYFSDDLKKVENILSAFTDKDLLSYLEGLGGLFTHDERGRVYPTGKQASAVTDLLRFALQDKGVTLLLGEKVEKIEKRKGGFCVQFGHGTHECDILVVALGGKSAKNFGTDGNGYALLNGLGHSVTPLYPALVQLKTDGGDCKPLRGIRVDVLAKAYDGERFLSETRGDVIFTEYGVSGNAVFSLSSYLTDKKKGGLTLDLLPEVSGDKLKQVISAKWNKGEKQELLGCILNNQVGRVVMKRALSSGEVSVERVVKEVKNFTLSINGSLGFDYAQVTRGGVPMSEVTDELESKKVDNLYLLGEILNVDGECGGYNLQWAFSSAACVARAIQKRGK